MDFSNQESPNTDEAGKQPTPHEAMSPRLHPKYGNQNLHLLASSDAECRLASQSQSSHISASSSALPKIWASERE
jgi:hypothetical protein